MVTVKKATLIFRSYEVKCDEKLVGEWMDNNPVGRELKDLRSIVLQDVKTVFLKS